MVTKRNFLMGKFLILIMFALFATVQAYASHVSRQQALNVAAGFWNSNIGRVEGLREFRVCDSVHGIANSNMYVVLRANGEGFVIVSADDRVRPILAYSPTGTIDSTSLPCNTKTMLDWYNRQINEAIEKDMSPSNDVIMQWRFFTMFAVGLPMGFSYYAPLYYGTAGRYGVMPMLTTKWNQSPLYNDMCPMDLTNGGRSVVGCVATAMSQIMRYWKHPYRGVSSNSYHDTTVAEVGVVSADFGNTVYDWANMPDQLISPTAAQINAVATLCFHCGVAVNMMYSSLESGAFTISNGPSYPCAENALRDYFRYSSSLRGYYRDYDFTSDTAWENMLKAEMDEGRPVLYSGYDATAGHAFVCDGYDMANAASRNLTYFHFNWGWGGMYDGYFTTDHLAPMGGGIGSNSTNDFTTLQNAIVGIEPDSLILKVTPCNVQVAAVLDSSRITVKTSTSNANGWTAMTSASWIHLENTSGNGGGATATIRFTVDSNDGLCRVGYITIRQGYEAKIVKVLQNRAEYSPAGYYGFNQQTIHAGIGPGDEILMRGEAFGNYAPGDTVTEVFFKSSFIANDGWSSYDNNNFKISIYESPDYTQELSRGEMVAASDVLPTPVRTQNYFQNSYDLHEIPLTTPYVIGQNPFWVGLKMRGGSIIDGNINYSDILVPDSLFPVVDSLKGLYLIRSYLDSIYMPVTSYCMNSLCDTVFQGEYVFCFGFKVSPRMREGVVVTAESSDTNRGIAIGGGTYYYGDMVILNALPKPGHYFQRWQDGNRDNPRTFTINGSQSQSLSFVATFGVGSITEAEFSDFSVAVTGRTIAISGTENNAIRLFDVLGRMLYFEKGSEGTKRFTVPAKGVYLVKVGNTPARKILVVE